MKKRSVIWILLAVLLAGIIALICWQFNNIKMAYYFMKYDNSQIESLMKDNNNDVDNHLNTHEELNVRPPTELEQTLHQDNLLTEEEFIDILTGKTNVQTLFGTDVQLGKDKNFTTKDNKVLTPENLLKNKTEALKIPKPNGGSSQDGNTSSENAVNQDASAYVAKVYVLKSSFESRLNGLYHEAISYYKSLPAEQKKNAKGEMISRFYSRAASLEASCDAQMNAILNDLSASLKATGGDISLVSKIRQAYQNEKSLKKSYYLNLVK